jgi:hypothetical protein
MQAEPPGPPPIASRPRIPRSRRLLTAVIAVMAVAALVTGIRYLSTGDPATPSPEADQSARPDPQAVAAVLAGRARAVRGHDRTAFLATVASANPAFQAAQGRLFDDLAQLPLAGWRQELGAPEPLATGPGGATLRVILHYRLRGFDQHDVTRTEYLSFARRSGSGWVIVGDGAAQGLRDDPEIWDGGHLTVVRGRHSLVIGDQAANGELREIGRRLDAAVPLITGIVGRHWDRGAVALVPADQARAEALAGGDQNLSRIAALATTTQSAAGDGQPGADRIVILPESFATLSALGRSVVLTHELTHIATGGARDGRTPIWLIEGLADYAGYKSVRVPVRSAAQELRREVVKGRLPARLPDRADFGDAPGRLPQAYEEAWLACRMVAERYGEPTLVRLYRAAGAQPESAFRRVLGVDAGEFTAMWRDYLRKELG